MASYTPPTSFTTSYNTMSFNSMTSTTPASEISPSSLDALPILASILERLQNNPTSSLNPGSTPNTSQPQSQSQTQGKDFSNPFSTAPLTTKDIPAATGGLKHRLQKTRKQVAQLPDMERTIVEQEVEIGELEARILEQRRVLEMLRGMSGSEGTER
jgi:hypothetical protein